MFSLTVLALAIALTSFVAMVVGLARKHPRYRSLLTLVFPPIGVVFCFYADLKIRALIFSVSSVAYLILRLVG